LGEGKPAIGFVVIFSNHLAAENNMNCISSGAVLLLDEHIHVDGVTITEIGLLHRLDHPGEITGANQDIDVFRCANGGLVDLSDPNTNGIASNPWFHTTPLASQ
jgi:hypothetical protein